MKNYIYIYQLYFFYIDFKLKTLNAIFKNTSNVELLLL